MILMTGPTGSGKNGIALYWTSNPQYLRKKTSLPPKTQLRLNLCGVNQVQVQPKIGFGFAEALRSFLRQDPDIVMVGEIRDIENSRDCD